MNHPRYPRTALVLLVLAVIAAVSAVLPSYPLGIEGEEAAFLIDVGFGTTVNWLWMYGVALVVGAIVRWARDRVERDVSAGLRYGPSPDDEEFWGRR